MELLFLKSIEYTFNKLGSKSLILVTLLKNNFDDFLYSVDLWFSFMLVIISL